MILDLLPIYPSAGRYVVRLHRDARPQAGVLAGRIEQVSSGDDADFTSAAELLAWLGQQGLGPSAPAGALQPR
jgi:hypothetical protein